MKSLIAAIVVMGLMAVVPAVSAYADPSEAPGRVVPASDSTFQSEVYDVDVPVLVEFWENDCEDCITMKPALKALAFEYQGKVKVVTVDVSHYKDTAAEYGVDALPAFFMHNRDGVVTAEVVGGMSRKSLVDQLRIEEMFADMESSDDEYSDDGYEDDSEDDSYEDDSYEDDYYGDEEEADGEEDYHEHFDYDDSD